VQVGFGYSLLAYSSTQRGISKLQLDRAALAADLENAWEVRRVPSSASASRHPGERYRAHVVRMSGCA
jgi:adenylosuccinate lyase